MFTFNRCARVLGAVWLGLAGMPASAADLEVSVRDLAGKSLQDAVVYAERAGGAAAPAGELARASIDQVNREFVPLVTVIRTNTEVSFPNSDNIRHSIYSFSPPKTFTTRLYSGKQAPPLVFDKPGLVVLGCNIHDTMVAWVVVVDTPYFGKTGANGSATLTGLGAGDYRVSVWYPQPQFQPTSNQVHIGAEPVAHVEFKVDSSASQLPELRARAAAPAKH